MRFHERTNGKYLHSSEEMDDNDVSCEGSEYDNKSIPILYY